MTDFKLNLIALAVALIAQATLSGVSIEKVMNRTLPVRDRLLWLMLAGGSLLLALHHGYTLELALHVGIFDLRQSVLGALAGLMFVLGVRGLSRRLP